MKKICIHIPAHIWNQNMCIPTIVTFSIIRQVYSYIPNDEFIIYHKMNTTSSKMSSTFAWLAYFAINYCCSWRSRWLHQNIFNSIEISTKSTCARIVLHGLYQCPKHYLMRILWVAVWKARAKCQSYLVWFKEFIHSFFLLTVKIISLRPLFSKMIPLPRLQVWIGCTLKFC